MVKNPSTNAGDAADLCWIPGLGRSPGGGNGNPLQYSWLESPKWIEEPGRLQFMGAQSDMTEYMNEAYIPGFGARHPGQLAFTSFLILDIFLNLSVFLFFFFPHQPFGNSIFLARLLGRLEIIYVKPLQQCVEQKYAPAVGPGFGFFSVQLQICWLGRPLSGIPEFILLEGDLGESAPSGSFSGPWFLSKD